MQEEERACQESGKKTLNREPVASVIPPSWWEEDRTLCGFF